MKKHKCSKGYKNADWHALYHRPRSMAEGSALPLCLLINCYPLPTASAAMSSCPQRRYDRTQAPEGGRSTHLTEGGEST
eukprot:5569180-Alexandrium_andersonii.AAC.1